MYKILKIIKFLFVKRFQNEQEKYFVQINIFELDTYRNLDYIILKK